MFKSKNSRAIVSWVVMMIFNFTCLWGITNDPVDAIKALLVCYFVLAGAASSWMMLQNWVEAGELENAEN